MLELFYKIRKKYRAIMNKPINKKRRKEIKNSNFTIISCNCLAGIIYNNLGMRFDSPTINMFICPKDFVKLCNNMDYYFSLKLEELKEESEKQKYPVALCGDIKLFGMHYDSFEDMETKWYRRIPRIHKDNMFFIMQERDGCTLDDIVNFDKLPFDNKVVFVSKNMPNIKSSLYVPGTENKNDDFHHIKSLTDYKSKIGYKRLLEKFDYTTFLNNGTIRLTKDRD